VTTLTIRRSPPLHGSITVPGDKSISHRALLLGSIAEGRSHVTNFLDSTDCAATLGIVRALGISVQAISPSELVVEGRGLHGLREASTVLDCMGSGTTMRLLAGLLAGQPFLSILAANIALSRRPMDRIAVPLRLLGATVLGRQGGKLPPLAISGGHLHGIEYATPVASAQVKSGILLAGLYADSPTTVHEPAPSRDHSERMLRALGVTVRSQGTTIVVEPPTAPLPAFDINVPGDISSAAFPIIAGCLVPGSAITIRNTGVNPTRSGILDALARMGAGVDQEAEPPAGSEPVAALHVRAAVLQATTIAGDEIPRLIDELPILAVAATQAHGVTTVHDAAELRVKESDRIASLAAELRKMGAHIEEFADGFAIEGPSALHGAVVETHRDHRLAMALAVAGLVAAGETTITGAECIDDSYPEFAAMLAQLGALP
jgi:3-phosphoshikimate 1-carboxyvinyltransferase